MSVLYFGIALIASLLGALAGLGGGMIIKPVLDLFNHFNAETISMLSSFAVFSMSLVTLCMQLIKGIKLRKSLWLIAGGAALGGLLGKFIFQMFMILIGDDSLSKGYQSLLLLLVLAFALVMSDITLQSKHLKNPLVYFICGLLLGALSTFLGIGGGPLNVAMLVTLFSMDRKDEILGSIFIIFASQGVRLLTATVSGTFESLNLDMGLYLIMGGVLGGLLGGILYRRMAVERIMIIFNFVTLSVILICIYNAWRFFNAY